MSPTKTTELVRKDGAPMVGTIIDDAGYRAYKMRLGGADWEKVAKATGYASPRGAQVGVRQYITKAAVEMDQLRREEVVNLEMERLDALQDAIWDQAMDGDTKAVDSVLRVMGQRAKLLGLDLVAGGDLTQNTLVIQGDTDEFIRGLRLVRDPEGADGDG